MHIFMFTYYILCVIAGYFDILMCLFHYRHQKKHGTRYVAYLLQWFFAVNKKVLVHVSNYSTEAACLKLIFTKLACSIKRCQCAILVHTITN